jgi:hypothetical protein
MEELNKKRTEFFKRLATSESKEATIEILVEWCSALELAVVTLNRALDEVYK